MKDFNKLPADCWHKLSLFKIWQKPEEWIPFMQLVRDRSMIAAEKGKQFTVVEIGSYAGGTSIMFAQYADLVIGIDGADPLAGCDNVRYVVGNSHSIKTQLMVRDLLRNNRLLKKTEFNVDSVVDVLFIDGDHTFEGALQDYRDYEPFVRSGGIIAFHDIVNSQHHRDQGCRVDLTWEEVKKHAASEGWDTLENISGDDWWGGIGIIFKN